MRTLDGQPPRKRVSQRLTRIEAARGSDVARLGVALPCHRNAASRRPFGGARCVKDNSCSTRRFASTRSSRAAEMHEREAGTLERMLQEAAEELKTRYEAKKNAVMTGGN